MKEDRPGRPEDKPLIKFTQAVFKQHRDAQQRLPHSQSGRILRDDENLARSRLIEHAEAPSPWSTLVDLLFDCSRARKPSPDEPDDRERYGCELRELLACLPEGGDPSTPRRSGDVPGLPEFAEESRGLNAVADELVDLSLDKQKQLIDAFTERLGRSEHPAAAELVAFAKECAATAERQSQAANSTAGEKRGRGGAKPSQDSLARDREISIAWANRVKSRDCRTFKQFAERNPHFGSAEEIHDAHERHRKKDGK